jgi:hypothetical protein
MVSEQKRRNRKNENYRKEFPGRRNIVSIIRQDLGATLETALIEK